jgi:hypothetical protein
VILKAAATGAARSRWRPISILFTLAAPLLLYVIVRTALAGLPSRQAILLPPENEAATLRRAARDVANPKFVVDQSILALVNPAARSDPLTFEPFFIAARAAEQAGDRPRSLALLEEARRRRPTWLPIRLLLVSAYFNSGRRGDMAKEIDYILRMNEQARIVMLPELVKLLRFADGREYIAACWPRTRRGRPISSMWLVIAVFRRDCGGYASSRAGAAPRHLPRGAAARCLLHRRRPGRPGARALAAHAPSGAA